MMTKPTDHDEYSAAAKEFARPILSKVRTLVHEACPAAVESMKWSTPHFESQGNLLSTAAFNKHVNLTFWRGEELSDPKGLLTIVGKTGMGSIRVETLHDLPSDAVLKRYIKEAARLNKSRPSLKRKAKSPAPKAQSSSLSAKSLRPPADLLLALDQDARARGIFDGFSPSVRRDYIEWVVGAKRQETREKRIKTAVGWISEGKPRNWKYMKQWQ